MDAYEESVVFHTGDTIKIAMNIASNTTGTVVISNQSTGKAYTQQFNVDSDSSLCQTEVDLGLQVVSSTLANFGSITFTDAGATVSSGATIGMGEATDVWEITDSNGMALTSTSLNPDGTMTVSYVQEW
jgi:hypothetical protein